MVLIGFSFFEAIEFLFVVLDGLVTIFIPPSDIFFLEDRLVFNSIDFLAASRLVSVKCSTIESILSWLSHWLDYFLGNVRLIRRIVLSSGFEGSNKFLIGWKENG